MKHPSPKSVQDGPGNHLASRKSSIIVNKSVHKVSLRLSVCKTPRPHNNPPSSSSNVSGHYTKTVHPPITAPISAMTIPNAAPRMPSNAPTH